MSEIKRPDGIFTDHGEYIVAPITMTCGPINGHQRVTIKSGVHYIWSGNHDRPNPKFAGLVKLHKFSDQGGEFATNLKFNLAYLFPNNCPGDPVVIIFFQETPIYCGRVSWLSRSRRCRFLADQVAAFFKERLPESIPSEKQSSIGAW